MNWKISFLVLLEITLGLLLSAMFNLSVPATFGILTAIAVITWWTWREPPEPPTGFATAV